MNLWATVVEYWKHITATAATIDLFLLILFIPWILSLKKEPTSAIAWCLLVILVPFFGMGFFILFGYQNVHRPLKKKKAHRQRYRGKLRAALPIEAPSPDDQPEAGYEGLALLAEKLGGSPPTGTNKVAFYHEGHAAFEAVFAEIEAARHHVHLQFFIFRNDDLGNHLVTLLTQKAKEGLEVRVLTDGFGARSFGGRKVRALVEAGGRVTSFLPVSLWRRRLQVNLRNHRKIVVVDGRAAFTGGLNVGDEYLGRNRQIGYWRDTFFRVEGPAVEHLQRLFIEDWDFAAGEELGGARYFADQPTTGNLVVQVVASGPDQDVKSIREMYFAAIMKAKHRLWITTPYYVPDPGLRDALAMSALCGVDVRLLMPRRPDHWMPYFAGRYFLGDLLAAGVKLYYYRKGFIHAKIVLVDGQWASVGTANLDNRSLLLNFEVNCMFHSPGVVADLERTFEQDLEYSTWLKPDAFAKRSWQGKVAENVCRLFAPVL